MTNYNRRIDLYGKDQATKDEVLFASILEDRRGETYGLNSIDDQTMLIPLDASDIDEYIGYRYSAGSYINTHLPKADQIIRYSVEREGNRFYAIVPLNEELAGIFDSSRQ